MKSYWDLTEDEQAERRKLIDQPLGLGATQEAFRHPSSYGELRISATAIAMFAKCEQLRIEAAKLDAEVGQTLNRLQTAHEERDGLKAQLAAAEAEIEEQANAREAAVGRTRTAEADRDQLRARVAELEAAGQRAANMAATATTSAVGNACIVRRMTEEAEQQRAQLATAVGALEEFRKAGCKSGDSCRCQGCCIADKASAALARLRGGA